ncbi:MAG: glycosyltransferase family 4 protein [Clostridiales bacterium]|nr:glycosyltransferase family 4 protein [Clostridiales bacterium]
MIHGKTIGIDARMIEMSGIGIYIQHQMGRGIYEVAVGREEEIRKYDRQVRVIPFEAPIYQLKEQLRFPEKEIRKAGVDLMHFPHYNVPLSYRGRFAVTVHDLTHLILPEFLGNRVKYEYAKTLMAHALRKSEKILTVSENSKKDILKFFPDLPPAKITVVGSAIEDDFGIREKKDLEYLYDRFRFPRDRKMLLYVGNLKPHKNLRRLLEAFHILNREDTILVLAGKAFQSLSLEQQEEELGIRGRTVHTGLVTKEELIDLYNLTDLFVFPSLYEGFGLPPLEAMACGTPVVAANNSSIPEVVGDAARLVDAENPEELAEAIRDVLDHPDQAEELIRRGLRRCRFMTPAQVSGKIQAALSELL